MDLLLPTHNLSTISNPSFFNPSRRFHTKPNNGGISIPAIRSISLKSNQNNFSSSSSRDNNDYLYKDDDGSEFIWGDDSKNTVEVIGIGSRKDAILDFCFQSPFQASFSSLRFWTILLSDSSSVQLQQRSIGKDIILRNMDLRASQLSAPRTVILVATAGYGSDHLTAIELLGAVKSAAGLAVGIVLKPFGFEGQRRQEEVTELVTELRDHTNFCIVVDTDLLLKKEAVTLAEALKSANNAVLLSINSIFALTCESHKKLFDCLQTKRKELEFPELLKLMENQEEARVGFGAANNFKSSIARAVFDCPFIADGLKELDGVAFCMLACATPIENSKLHSFLHIFRQTTGWQKEIVLSTVHEPNLEPNLFVTTVIVCGSATGENVLPRNGFISGLAQRFPFVFSLLGRDLPNLKDPEQTQFVENSCSVQDTSLSDTREKLTSGSSNDRSRNPNQYPDERLTVSGNNNVENQSLSEVLSEDKNIEGEGSSEEPFMWWNDGPNVRIAEEWAKERASISGSNNTILDNPCPYTLPVGVKLSQESIDTPKFSKTQFARSRISKGTNEESPRSQNAPSWDALMDIYNNATSTILKGTDSNASSNNKQRGGLLSTRAASMLEGERDSEKRWTPNIEMQYRGGIYKGRCQGGLPEGKGSLTLVDGSIYDGMWRYGKKSGIGTFYYSNGDVFQGSWRDDLMHGKGWFYFRSGDRWFANFWKGKANGEGRFYSKDGEIFFGNFQDGWRHGQCLCISVDGARWIEIWEEGELLDRQKDRVGS